MKLLFDAAETAGTTGAGAVTLDHTFRIVLIVMLLACGAYALYSAVRLHKTCELFDNKFLYPGNCKPADCLDPLGFIEFIVPRCAIFAVILVVLGVLDALVAYVLVPSWMTYFEIAMIVLPVLDFIWLIAVQRKAARDFWGE